MPTNFDQDQEIDPTPPPDEPGGEPLPDEEIEGKESVSGWMVALGLVVGVAAIACGIGFALPWLVAVGGAIVIATVLSYATAKLADYAVARPFKGAGNALSHVYNAVKELVKGNPGKAGAELAQVEASDWFYLLVLLVLAALLVKWLFGRQVRRGKVKR